MKRLLSCVIALATSLLDGRPVRAEVGAVSEIVVSPERKACY